MKFSMPNRESLDVTFEEGEFAGQTIHFDGYGIIGGFIAEICGACQVVPLPPRKAGYTNGRRIREVTGDELTRMTKEILAYCATLPEGASYKKIEFREHWLVP